MNIRHFSLVGLAFMASGIVWPVQQGELFARSTPGICVQVAAVALMIAARLTFGSRSFHAAADPTAGGLVTTGPYAVLRHPIYSAVLYFVWATALDHHEWPVIASALLTTSGAGMRMYAEETLLAGMYPGYAAYGARTARVIPFVF